MWASGRGAEVGVQRAEKDEGGWGVAETREQGRRDNHKARRPQEGVGGRGACGCSRPRATSHLPPGLEAANQRVNHCSFTRERKKPQNTEPLTAS